MFIGNPAQSRFGDLLGEQCVEVGRTYAPRELSGISAPVVVEALLLVPQPLQPLLGALLPRQQFACIGFAPQQLRQLPQRAAIHYVQPRQAHILQLHHVLFVVKRYVVVHRRVIQPGLQRAAKRIVYSVGLPYIAALVHYRIAAPAQCPAVRRAMRIKPAVPLHQLRIQRLHQPLLAITPVRLQHHRAAHWRLRAILALEVSAVYKVGHKALCGMLRRYLDQVAVRDLAIAPARHEPRKVVVPAEQHVSTAANAPQPADRRYHTIILGIVDCIPGYRAFHRRIHAAQLAIFGILSLKRSAALRYQRLHLCQRALRSGIECYWTVERDRNKRRLSRYVGVERRRRTRRAYFNIAVRPMRHEAICAVLHPARPIPQIAALQRQHGR